MEDDPNRCGHFWPVLVTLADAPWHALYSHHVYLICVGLSFGWKMTKNKKFVGCWVVIPKRSLYPHTLEDDPNRCGHFWSALVALLGALWHALYSHRVYLVWIGLSFGWKMVKNRIFVGCWVVIPKRSLYPISWGTIPIVAVTSDQHWLPS